MGNSIRQIGILGAGQMGDGIAQTAAQTGFEVLLADQNLAIAEKGKSRIAARLSKMVEKGKLAESDAREQLAAIRAVDGIGGLSRCEMVIEAVTENAALKFDLFRKLDDACAPGAILATNTSSISITIIAAQTKRPEKVAGIHFMNPVPVMKLVEGIRGLQTSDETFRLIRGVSEQMGKTFVAVKDIPGFAVNRILMPMINEAVTVLYEGIASVEDIDAAMKLGTNQPMGPLTLADFIGLDTCLAIMEVLHEGMGDSKYRPCPLLKQYVAAGWFGKKTGRGFYRYDT
ncbi:MAG: 3-hydroxybutyryl-CoA dehydrogenase [Deltaproteobacteria bacterium]|nr:3-hydroxybutyryl-CoA dehydrogenase [Deltaproteobacteria bacterium]